MGRAILVPKILPNNLRIIRDMRGLTVKKVAEDLKIDRNFLSAVEQEYKNFSGKTTIRAMKYYDITFYQMYDVKDTRKLECVYLEDEPTEFDFSIEIDISEELEQYSSEKELLEEIKIDDSEIEKEILRQLKDRDLKGEVDNYLVKEKYIQDNKLYLNVTADILKQVEGIKEFDINFSKNENKELTQMLRFTGFALNSDKKTIKINGLDAKLENDYIVFNNPLKILETPKTDPKKYEELDKININDKRIKLNKKNDKIISVTLNVAEPQINNLKEVRTLMHYSIEDMHQALGLSYNGYINLELGNQKISTKIMWRLVQFLKVPLELIINVDEYYKKYCQHDKKIKKPRD